MKLKALNKRTGLYNSVEFKRYSDFGNIKDYLSYLRSVIDRNPAFIDLFAIEQRKFFNQELSKFFPGTTEYKALIQKFEIEQTILDMLVSYNQKVIIPRIQNEQFEANKLLNNLIQKRGV